MPGVVVVETLGKGHILLHAAPDQSTRHIADLVSKQYDPFRKVGCGYNHSRLSRVQTSLDSYMR